MLLASLSLNTAFDSLTESLRSDELLWKYLHRRWHQHVDIDFQLSALSSPRALKTEWGKTCMENKLFLFSCSSMLFILSSRHSAFLNNIPKKVFLSLSNNEEEPQEKLRKSSHPENFKILLHNVLQIVLHLHILRRWKKFNFTNVYFSPRLLV